MKLVLFAAALICAQGQWLNYPTPGTPRTRDGKPDLTAKAPRASNGKPDLSGVWQGESGSPAESEKLLPSLSKAYAVPGDDPSTFSKYSINILADFKDAPYRPEVLQALQKAGPPRGPAPVCMPMGLPWADILNFAPFKIIQTSGVTIVLYEADNMHRQIYTDGRKLPTDPQPAWLGYSVGQWQGDTLVVDSAGFNDKSRLDFYGHPHSEEMRVEERFHRRDFGHLDVSVTIDDPKTYTQPINVKVTQLLVPDSDVIESICNENEKDRAHLK